MSRIYELNSCGRPIKGNLEATFPQETLEYTGLLFRNLISVNHPPIVEKQMDKKMENETESEGV